MKHFFTIELHHEYDMGIAQQLAVIPTVSEGRLIRNNSVLFRNQSGSLVCYIEDDESVKNEIDYLNFWVICNDNAIYNYTDLDLTINFYKPHFYWSNSNSEDTKLKTSIISEKLKEIDGDEKALEFFNHLLIEAPKNAIGMLQIKLGDVQRGNEKSVVEFKVKKTIWQYNISPKEEQKDWNYRIEDEMNEWKFKRLTEIKEYVTFQSTEPIPFNKQASNRLKLIWEPIESNFEEEQNMILPFANYSYKMVSEDNKELTPIYIHI